jgi:hypothetical protein
MSKEQQMRALFDQWRASGMPRTTFARERQIPINTFHYWCQRFEGKRKRRSRSSAVANTATSEITIPPVPAFVEIAEPLSPPTAHRQPRLSVALPDGTTITVY